MFEIVQHSDDVRLRVTAPTIEELFGDALRGLMAVMSPRPAPDAASIVRAVKLDSVDRTSLLVDFLGEALVRTQIESAVFEGIACASLTESSVEAELFGVAPAEFDKDVKAVTFHEADVRHEQGVWTTTIVLEV